MTTHTPLAMPLVAHVAAMSLWLVGCSPLSENHVPTTISILHWLNTFCCTRQLGTFLFTLGYQSSRLQAAEIDRGRHLLQMHKISRLTMLTFSVAEEARHSVAPNGSIEEHLCFFIDIFNNLLDSNLSKVSTDAKSNPEFIKPKRWGMPYCKDNHIILCPRFVLPICEVLVVHNAQRGVECAYLPPHGNMVGDTRHPSRHSVWRRSFHPLY